MPRKGQTSRVMVGIVLVVLVVAVFVTRSCRMYPTTSLPVAPAAVSAALSGQSTSSPVASGTSQPYDATQLDLRVTQATIGTTIGISGYTARVRPPETVTDRIKRDLMRQHGYTDPPSDYELDHFIPLGVGGSSNLINLWLEPIAEARKKDVDETLAHENVTGGKWTLARGQQYIRDRWRIHYAH